MTSEKDLKFKDWLDRGLNQETQTKFQIKLSQTDLYQYTGWDSPLRQRACHSTSKNSPEVGAWNPEKTQAIPATWHHPSRCCPNSASLSAARNHLRPSKPPSGVPQISSQSQYYLNLEVYPGATLWDEPKYASIFLSVRPQRSMQYPLHILQWKPPYNHINWWWMQSHRQRHKK